VADEFTMSNKGQAKFGAYETEDGMFVPTIVLETAAGQEIEFEMTKAVKTNAEAEKICHYVFNVLSGFGGVENLQVRPGGNVQ
jgi:hypothetical protein